jgi:hypothetical protein
VGPPQAKCGVRIPQKNGIDLIGVRHAAKHYM